MNVLDPKDMLPDEMLMWRAAQKDGKSVYADWVLVLLRRLRGGTETAKFVVGDRVRVVGNNNVWRETVGTVDAVGPKVVSVHFQDGRAGSKSIHAMEDELRLEPLPCPFCATPPVVDPPNRDGQRVRCANCGVRTSSAPLAEAIAAWNRRAL